jgi:hypothetical protein
MDLECSLTRKPENNNWKIRTKGKKRVEMRDREYSSHSLSNSCRILGVRSTMRLRWRALQCKTCFKTRRVYLNRGKHPSTLVLRTTTKTHWSTMQSTSSSTWMSRIWRRQRLTDSMQKHSLRKTSLNLIDDML